MTTDVGGFAFTVVGFDLCKRDGLAVLHASALSMCTAGSPSVSLWIPNRATSAFSSGVSSGAGLVMGEPFVDDLIDAVGSV